jgi:hypothetical protein
VLPPCSCQAFRPAPAPRSGSPSLLAPALIKPAVYREIEASAGLEREHLQVTVEVLEPASSSCTVILLSVAFQALHVVLTGAANWLDRFENRAGCACAVGAPPTVVPRTGGSPSAGGGVVRPRR